MEPLQQSEPDRTIYNEKNRDDQVQEARHDQDEHTRKQRQDRRDMGDGDVHEFSFRGVGANRGGIIADWVPRVETHWARASSRVRENSPKMPRMRRAFSGTSRRRMHWQPVAPVALPENLLEGVAHAEQDSCSCSARGRDRLAPCGAGAKRRHSGTLARSRRKRTGPWPPK